MENMITLTIDGIEVQAPQGSTVLEADRLAGIRIPTLCYLKDIRKSFSGFCAKERYN